MTFCAHFNVSADLLLAEYLSFFSTKSGLLQQPTRANVELFTDQTVMNPGAIEKLYFMANKSRKKVVRFSSSPRVSGLKYSWDLC